MLVTNQAATIRGVTMKSCARPCCGLPVPSKVRGELSRVRLPAVLRGTRRLDRPGPLPSGLCFQVACALVGVGILQAHGTGSSTSQQ